MALNKLIHNRKYSRKQRALHKRRVSIHGVSDISKCVLGHDEELFSWDFPGGVGVKTPSFHCRGTGSIPSQGNFTCPSHGMAKKKKRKNRISCCGWWSSMKNFLVNRVTLLWETPRPKEHCSARTAEHQCCYSKWATEFPASWSFVLPASAPRFGWWYMYVSF